MKKITITLFCLALTAGAAKAQASATAAVAAAQAKPVVDGNAGKFQFENETHDFGTVIEGPHAEYDFVFTNSGKTPIVITEARGSCGCTVPTWTHEPILPGQKSKIHVSYDTNHRQGTINKDVYITSNAVQSPMRLHIQGNVAPAPQTAPPPTLDGK